LPVLVFAVCEIEISAQEYEPVISRQETVKDTFFNHYIVEDNYRWLENTDSAEVKDWVEKQNKITTKFLSKAIIRYNTYNSIPKYGFTSYNFPYKAGKYYFYWSSSDIYYKSFVHGNPVVLVGVHSPFNKDKINIENFSVSKNIKYLAYQFSRNGTDRTELKIVSIKSGTHEKDHLINLRFAEDIAWKGDGFFYSRYPETELYDITPRKEIYFHKIGTTQDEDQLIFKRDYPGNRCSFLTTSDERFLIVYDAKKDMDKMNIYFIDYQSDNPVLKPIITNIDVQTMIIDSYNTKFIAITHYKSKNGSVVEIDPSDPYKWRVIIPEYADAELLNVFTKKNCIIVHYKIGQNQYIVLYNYQGELLSKIKLPPTASVGGFSAAYDEEEIIYSYTTYTLPHIVYSLNTKTFENKLFDETSVTFDYTNIIYEEVDFFGKDSIPVPMILVYEKNLKKNGENPAILETYGGYGLIEQASFNPGIVYFVKHGGVYAFANVRGSGEKGEDWGKQGKGLNKQTTIDDFIAAAEYLVNEGYTSSNKLAATGASHGGLVVAAAAVQRPDLFKAVVPIVAATDMIRFEKFTVGAQNADEFGTIKDSLSFANLYSYSPYHKIKDDVNYPSMLIMTSEFDDRVPPFHSYKFAARLQSRPAQKNPVLLRIEKKGGHSDAKNDEYMYGFIMKELLETK